MDAEHFVECIRRHVRDAAVEDTIGKLKQPPGRRALPEKKARSDWFNGLTESDASFVKKIIEDSVDEAIFGLFAVFDGSRTIFEGRIELRYVGEAEILLNDPSRIGLNEIYNAID